VSDADSSASGAEQANEPSFELCPAEAMSDRGRGLARSALSDPEAFSHMQLNAVEGVELWDLLLSLTIHQVSAACEIPRTCDLLSRHGTILTSPLQELINAIRKNHLARKLKKRLETTPIVSLNPMNMAPFELQWLIGQGWVTALQSRTPPTDVIFAAIGNDSAKVSPPRLPTNPPPDEGNGAIYQRLYEFGKEQGEACSMDIHEVLPPRSGAVLYSTNL
jgi:hypothetical protein